MNTLPDDVGRRLRDSLNHGAAPELSTDLVTGAAAHPAPKLANPRARIQVAGGATLLVAAVAAFALVIAPGLNTAPLFTAAASGANGKASSEAVPAANGLFRIWADYVYHAGDGLSTSGGTGDVYQLTRVGSASDRAAALASIFGVTGEATAVDNSDPANPSWTVGNIDGSAPSVQLTWSGTGDWWYSDPSAEPAIACPPTAGSGGGSSGSSSGSTDGSTSGSSSGDPTDCASSTPPSENLAPTGADALAKAQALFAQTGLDVSTGDIKLFGDSTQETATASFEVGGVQTALEWGVTWSDTGKIAQAYGSSITAVDRGSYGTISATDAVDRLNDSRWYGTAGPKYSGGIRAFAMLGVGARAGTSTGGAPVPGAVSNAPSDDSTPAPTPIPTGAPNPVTTATPVPIPTAVPTGTPTDVPTDTPTGIATPEPTPTGPPIINVTIKKAESTLVLMWDSKGDAWLVPGYAMQVENGWWDAVVSLVPGVIELPPVPTVEPDIAP